MRIFLEVTAILVIVSVTIVGTAIGINYFVPASDNQYQQIDYWLKRDKTLNPMVLRYLANDGEISSLEYDLIKWEARKDNDDVRVKKLLETMIKNQ